MRIALVHTHYNEEHLAQVMEEMKQLGAPKIHAVWHPAYGHWVALEGCHKIRAAKELGLTPEIIEPDMMATKIIPSVRFVMIATGQQSSSFKEADHGETHLY